MSLKQIRGSSASPIEAVDGTSMLHGCHTSLDSSRLHPSESTHLGPPSKKMGVLLFLSVTSMFIFGTVALDGNRTTVPTVFEDRAFLARRNLGQATESEQHLHVEALDANALHASKTSGASSSSHQNRGNGKIAPLEALWRDVGLGLDNNSPEAEEAFLAGEAQRRKQQAIRTELRSKRTAEAQLVANPVNSSPLAEVATADDKFSLPRKAFSPQQPCAGNKTHPCPLRIDLVMFVLFQKELSGHMFSGINWPWIPRLDHDLKLSGEKKETNMALQANVSVQSGGKDELQDVNDTRVIVQHLTQEQEERDRTRFAFVAVNPHVSKTFRLLPSQVSSKLRQQIYGSESEANNALVKEQRIVKRPTALSGAGSRGGGPALLSESSYRALTFSSQLVSVKASQLAHTVLAGRVLKEWEMPGYSASLGFAKDSPHDVGKVVKKDVAVDAQSLEQRNEIFHHLHEFGTMRTLYHSGLTFLHTNDAGAMIQCRSTEAAGANASLTGHRPKTLAADADGDGVQEWMGVFPHDFRLDLKLIQLIRRRIRQGTSRYLGRNVTFDSSSPSHPTAPKKKRPKAMFRGRVVDGSVINSDSVNKKATLPPLPAALAPELSLPANHHCCIFYSGSYPSVYLFNNALSQQLLLIYNAFYQQNVSFAHLTRPNAPDAILEAFVLPNALFNKVFPFVDHIIHMLVVDGRLFPNPEIPPTSSAAPPSEGNPSSLTPEPSTDPPPLPPLLEGVPIIATPTDVLERALAMALALEPKWLRIRLPVRHARDF